MRLWCEKNDKNQICADFESSGSKIIYSNYWKGIYDWHNRTKNLIIKFYII